jgi:hypothetical protein
MHLHCLEEKSVIKLTGARVEDPNGSATLFSSSTNGAGLLRKDIFCFKRIRISNNPNTNTGLKITGI